MNGIPSNAVAGRTRPHASGGWLLAGGLVVLLGIAYADTFKWLWYYWTEGDNWQFLIPIAFLYMLRERRDLYADLTRRPNVLPGTLLLILGSAMLIAGQLSSTNTLREASIVVNTFALTVLYFGATYARRLFWPLAYLGLMLSFPSELVGVLRVPLKLIAATVGEHVLRGMGFAIHRDGAFLQLPHITLEVADSCSGLNQFVSSIALGIPLAFTMLNRWWERIFIVAFSSLMGIVMNWVRVVLISIWHYDSAKPEVHGPHGIYELPFIFLVGVFITFMVARRLARGSPPPVRIAADMAADQAEGRGDGLAAEGTLWRRAAAIAGLTVLAPTAFFLATWEPEPVALTRGFSEFPMRIAGFAGHRIDQLGPPFRKGVAQEEFAARYVGPTGATAKVFVGYFPFQNDEYEVIDYRFNWLHDDARSIDVPTISPTPMKVARVKVDGRLTTAYFTYDVNGRRLVDPRKVKLASFVGALTRRQTNAAIVVVLFDGGEAERLAPDQQTFLEQVLAASAALLPKT